MTFLVRYLSFRIGFGKQSELTNISGLLSKSTINSDIAEKLKHAYSNYSFRTEQRKYGKTIIVQARVRSDDTAADQSHKHWYAYQELSNQIVSWDLT